MSELLLDRAPRRLVLVGFWLRISFSDGAVKDINVANVLARGGHVPGEVPYVSAP